METRAKTQNSDTLSIPTLGEGTVTYRELDDDAFDAMLDTAYATIRHDAEEGIRLSIEDASSCHYARERLRRRFEADRVPYWAGELEDGVWRIGCVATGSLIEVRLDLTMWWALAS